MRAGYVWRKMGNGVLVYRALSKDTYPYSEMTLAYIGHNDNSLSYYGQAYSLTDPKVDVMFKGYTSLEELKQVIETTTELME